MRDLFDQMTLSASGRYLSFLDSIRTQTEIAMHQGPISETVRNEAISAGQEVARSYLSVEQAYINEDTMSVARHAHASALSDLGAIPSVISDRFADFIFSASYYTTRMIAAQVERDVMAMAQYLRVAAQRVDLYVRSGRFTNVTALASVMAEDAGTPDFRYTDRAGRRYKSTKNIRDTYRLQLINTYNEVYMDVMAEHGKDVLFVAHEDPKYKWSGERIAIVGDQNDYPLYYDVRDEIFHPGSNALVSLLPQS